MAELYEIKHIRDPLWSKPTFALPGGLLSVVVDLPVSVEPAMGRLENSLYQVRLAVEEVVALPNGLRQLRCRVPVEAPVDFYCLRVAWSGGSAIMPNAVRVLREFTSTFQFIHLTDPHVCSASAAQPGRELAKVVEQVNYFDPAFVLLTGDLITRYGHDKEALPADTVSRDIKTAQQLLLKLRVPLFITAGNHDLAFRWIRKDYRRYIARPVDSHTMNYAFSYGSVRFISFEAFRFYDVADDRQPHSITSDQLEWLTAELAAAQHHTARVLFYHYDYGNQLLPIFDEYRVNLAMYGHTKPLTDEAVGSTPTITILDPSICNSHHFRLLRIVNGAVGDRPCFNVGTVAEGEVVKCCLENPNNATAHFNSALVQNNSGEHLTDLLLEFFMTRGEYAAAGARIERATESDETSVCNLRFDLGPHESKRIRIFPVSKV